MAGSADSSVYWMTISGNLCRRHSELDILDVYECGVMVTYVVGSYGSWMVGWAKKQMRLLYFLRRRRWLHGWWCWPIDIPLGNVVCDVDHTYNIYDIVDGKWSKQQRRCCTISIAMSLRFYRNHSWTCPGEFNGKRYRLNGCSGGGDFRFL